MAFNVTTKDNYWISPNAVSISLNALGDADRIQCSVAAGATILCYVKGVTDGDGLEFDVGHKYKHWPLSIAPTFFDTHTEKYLYVAIPRSSDKGTTAMFVFPSEKLDVYGCNELGEQIGSADNFYIWLQGIISSSGESGIVQRQWMQQPDWGWLDSNEQYSAGGDSTWWTYNPITDMVTFLKKIATAVFEYLKADDAEIGRLTVTNDAMINGTTYTDHVQSKDYTGDGMFDTGYLLQYLSGKTKLVVDQIVCRGKFVVNEIEDRIWTYSGGNLIFSAAGSTIFYVEYLDNSGTPLGYTYINSPWLLRKVPLLARVIAWSKRKQIQRSLTPEEKARVVTFRCYETSDDGTMQTRNWWHVGDIALCQTLNRVKNKSITSGSYSGSLSNTVYARRVIAIGSKKIAYADDNTIHDYVDLSRADCDPQYNDWPAAGDVLVQRGSFTNTDRQGFSTIEVTGDERGYKVYDGINGYDISGKKKTFIGYDARNQRALLEVFGDAYIGDMGNPDVHEGNSYVKYSAAQHLLKIKGIIEATSTVGDSQTTLANYINGVMDPTMQQVDADLESIKTQQELADGEIIRAFTSINLSRFIADSSVSLLNSYAADGVIDVHDKAYLRGFLEEVDGLYNETIGKATYYGVDYALFTQVYTKAKTALTKYTANPKVPMSVEQDYYNIAPFYTAYADLNLQIVAAANKKVDDILDDGILSAGSEKSSIAIDWLKAVSEYKKYMEQAGDYFDKSGQTATVTAAFTTAYTNLAKMLNNGATPSAAILNGTDMPAWLDRGTGGFNDDTVLSETPTQTSDNYRAVWNAYYTQLNALLEVITKQAKTLADAAQADADTALRKISDMDSDGKLDPSEKQYLKKEFESCYHEMMDSTGILDQAKDDHDLYIIDEAEWITPYRNAFAAIGTVLNGGTAWTIPSSLSDSTMPSWLKDANMGTTNELPHGTKAGSKWRENWSAFYTARAAVLTELTSHAQSTANTANTNAEAALQKISDMASDSKLDASEKQEVKKEFENSYHEMMDPTGILAKAKSGGSYIIDEATWITPYRNAFAAIGKYLNGGTNWSIPSSLTDSTMPSWIKTANMGTTNDIAGDTWRTLWSTFYTARAAVLTTLTEHAQSTANTAQTSAAQALAKISDMASDSKFDPSEKQEVKKEFENCYHEMMDSTGILAKAKSGGAYIIDEATWITPYRNAFAAIGKYLNSGTAWSIPTTLSDSTMPSWIKAANMSATNDIAGDTWRSLWSTFYTARAAVLTTLTEHAQSTANTAKTTADNTVTRLNNWASDSYISPAEKYALSMEWSNEQKIYQSLLTDAARYAVSTSALETAYGKANTAVTKYTAATPENIAVGSDYADIAAYYTAKKTVQDALTAAVYGKINQAQLDISALDYLKAAMEDGQTTTLGGLILSSTIALLDKQKNIQAGINGMYNTTLAGKTIAAWFGGPNVDHEQTLSAQSYAKILFRMDGTGYLAAGKITWNADGSGSVAGGNVSWDAGGNVTIQGKTIQAATSVNTPSLLLDGSDITSKLKAVIDMFELVTDSNNVTWVHVKNGRPLYSDSDISALGQSSGGGGGGGGASVLNDLNDVVISSAQNGQALLYDSASGKWKNQTVSGGGGGSLATLSDVNIGSQSDGQVLTWNASQRKWIASSVSGGLTMTQVWAALAADTLSQINISHLTDALAGYAKTTDLHSHTNKTVLDGISSTKVSNWDTAYNNNHTHSNKSVLDGISSDKVSHWDTAYGWGNHASAGYASASALNNYLPLSGGTLTGSLQVNATIFGYNYTNSNNAAAFIFDKPGSNYTGIGANGVSDQIYFGACNADGTWVTGYSQKWYFNGDVRASGNLQAQSVVIEKTNEINSYSGMLHLNYSVSTGVSLCIGGGYVGIGTTSPSYKLHVAGDIYASGDVTAASDGRQKDIVDDACLTVEQIAGAPAVKFTWKDKRDKDVHAGTIAQYWQDVLPEVVTDKDGSLGMNYGSASMISVVSLAREMMKMREHVSELEAEIKRLKEAN